MSDEFHLRGERARADQDQAGHETAEGEKRLAAEAAAELVQDGMAVGLGTGSTVAYLLPALARRKLSSVRYVASSPRTRATAVSLGLTVAAFDATCRLDLTIDGADQVAPDGWLVKGGGAAHTREKVVAAAADRFIVIVDARKPVAAVRAPIPVELLAFGLSATLRRLGAATVRDVPRSPDNGIIADYHGPVDEPARLAARLSATVGVVEHGLFPPELVATIFIGRAGAVERRDLR